MNTPAPIPVYEVTPSGGFEFLVAIIVIFALLSYYIDFINQTFTAGSAYSLIESKTDFFKFICPFSIWIYRFVIAYRNLD